ncbi:MAG: hypothetical protein ACLT2T_12045 [Bilophila wadsworthia]
MANVSSSMVAELVGIDVVSPLHPGTLMVCGPTPCTASRCSACINSSELM